MHLVDYLKDSLWLETLQPEFDKPYFKQLELFLNREIDQGRVFYPAVDKIFTVFNLLPLSKVRIVILGQDPYHQPEQAQGIAFSVPDGHPVPPSLKNIIKEVERSLLMDRTKTTDLTSWVKQGVLLLNTVLTVQANKANSHQKKGWELFTDQVISIVSNLPRPVIFMLWGNSAQQKECLIDPDKNTVLKTVHPSPLSAYRGFLGCNHFKKVNSLLERFGEL
ncbi:MAG: uracil-DNA glycosylase, partial [Proteobacteria bacterium]|nr:uracil-DNA glycosylase [Pseudomonadota bacterium]